MSTPVSASMSTRLAPLAALDAIRLWCFKRLGPVVVPFVRDRDLRECAIGASAIVFTLALTLLAPLWLLALGPIAVGVPHLLADVRYLVARPGLHRRRSLMLLAGLPVLAAGLGAGVHVGLLSGVIAALLARAPAMQRGITAALLLCIAGAFASLGSLGAVIFAHAHNALAVLLWIAWRPRLSGKHWGVLALYAAVTVALLSGATDSIVLAWRSLDGAPAGLELGHHVGSLALGATPPMTVHLVLAFAFAQAMHYAVWLRLIPEADRPRSTPRTYRASYAALESDFGRGPLLLCAAACVGLAAWALFDLAAAHAGYLRFALFHGHLEVAALTILGLEGKLSWSRGPSHSH
jgi:hypothetical protein